MATEVPLLEAASKLNDFYFFVPSLYGAVSYSEEDSASPQVKPILEAFHATVGKAEKLGVATTTVNSGIFAPYFFEMKYVYFTKHRDPHGK